MANPDDANQTPVEPRRETAEAEAPVMEGSGLDHPLVDTTSPPTSPIYLRPRGGPPLQAPAPAPDARTGILTGQSAAFVDALTKAIAQRLSTNLRPVVAAAVDDVLPMLLTLGSVPNPEQSPATKAGSPSGR